MRERLYRSRGDRMLLGVAGGMARYLDVDPSIVRIVWVLLVIAGGAGILLYIVAAFVIPEEPAGWAPAAPGGGAPGSPPPGTSPAAATGAAGTSSFGANPASWQEGERAGGERRDRGAGVVLIGLALVLIGAWLLLRRFIPEIDSDVVWPIVLVVLGGALVVGALRR
jgi:phage shock protein C